MKTITHVKTRQIATRPELMQFKAVESADGTNGRDAIKGKWNDLYAGIITIWLPLDKKQYGLKRSEKYIVVNGHHRLAHAKRHGVVTLRVQVLYEGKGPDRAVSNFTALAARRIGAEINIVDGKGSLFDQVKFLRDQRSVVGKEQSLARAKEIGISCSAAAVIAFNAKESLIAAFFAEKITPQQAEQIALAAPGADDLQRVGVQAALTGKTGSLLYHYVMAMKAMARGREDVQFDLFGNNDSAIIEATKMAQRAASYQREVKERIASAAGAACRPVTALSMGVNVADAAGTLKQLDALKQEKAKWDKWYLYPSLIAKVREGEGGLKMAA